MDTPVKRKGARAAPGPPPAETWAPAPDGGYAWFILLSCFMVFGLTFGVIKSFGVFFVEIHHYFESTATLASWITSIAVATIHVVAPLASALSAHYSHRSVVMIGGLICSIGMITGSFARNLFELYLTVGFLNGFGYALTWTPTVTMLGLYFDRRRPLANALASAGECILTFVLTPLSQLLIDSYSWRGALLILGGLQLNLCVCGQLLQPLKVSRDFTCLKEDKANGEEMEVLQKSKCLQKGDRISEEKLSESIEKTVLKTRILHYVDFTLITNARFMVYSMFGVFAALGFFAPSLYLVPYARSRGVEEYQSAALMSISSVLDLVGRVVFGWMANLRIIQTVHQLIATVILLASVLLLCPLASSFSELAVFSAVFGLVFGATVAIHITVLAEMVGVHQLGSALGFFMLIRSSGGLLGPPIAGFFIDQMSDYGAGFLMAGTALFISVLFLLLLHQMNRHNQRSSCDQTCTHTERSRQSHRDEEISPEMT